MRKQFREDRKASSPIGLPVTVLALIFVLAVVMVGASLVYNSARHQTEAIDEAAERGRELVRIYIWLNQTPTGNDTYSNNTIITLVNKGGETSLIDYYVVESRNDTVISKGDLTSEIKLGPGNSIHLDPSHFNLDTRYEDFWLFKDSVQAIYLHTKLGNTFGSAYGKPFVSGAGAQIVTLVRTTTLETLGTTVTTTYTLTTTILMETESTTTSATSATTTTRTSAPSPTAEPPEIFVYVNPSEGGTVRMRGSDGTDRSTTDAMYYVAQGDVTYQFTQTPLSGHIFSRWVVEHFSPNPNPPESGTYYSNSISFTAKFAYEDFKITAYYVRNESEMDLPRVRISAGVSNKEGGSFTLYYIKPDGTRGALDVNEENIWVHARPNSTATLKIKPADETYYCNKIVLNREEKPGSNEFSFTTSSDDDATDQVTVHFQKKVTTTHTSTLTTVSTITTTAYGSASDGVSFREVGFHSGTRMYVPPDGWEATPVLISVYARDGTIEATVAGVNVETTGGSASRRISAGWRTAWTWTYSGFVDIASGSTISASISFILRRVTIYTTTLTTTVTDTMMLGDMHIGASGVMMSMLLPPIALDALRRFRRSER